MLPSGEFLLGISKKASRSVRFLARLCLVLFVWLVFIPLGTCWICRLFFVRRLDVSLFFPRAVRFSFSTLTSDCIFGSFWPLPMLSVLLHPPFQD